MRRLALLVALLALVLGAAWLLAPVERGGALEREESAREPASPASLGPRPARPEPGAEAEESALAREAAHSAREALAVAAEEPRAAPAAEPPASALDVLVLVRTPSGEPFEQHVPRRAYPLVVVASRERPGERVPDGAWTIRDVPAVALDGTVAALPALLDERARGALVRLRLLEAGPQWLALVHEGEVLGRRRWTPGARELVFVLDPSALLAGWGTVRVQVVDGVEGAPVPELRAFVRLAEPVGGAGRLVRFPAAREGVLELGALPPGSHELLLDAAGHWPVVERLAVRAGQVTDLGTLAMRRSSGARLTVHLERPADAHTPWVRGARRQELEHGELRLVEAWKASPEDHDPVAVTLGGGAWIVWAEGYVGERALRSRAQELELADEGAAELRLRLEPTTRVLVRSGERELALRVLDLAGREGCAPVVLPAGAERKLDLLPGAYELRAECRGQTQRLPLTVGASDFALELR